MTDRKIHREFLGSFDPRAPRLNDSRDRACAWLAEQGFVCEEGGDWKSDWTHPDGRFAYLISSESRTVVDVFPGGDS